LPRRPNLTGGLSEELATIIEQILEQVGFIGDRKSFCELYGCQPKRLDGFLKTVRAQVASEKATDLSRANYHQKLRHEALPEELDGPVHCQVPQERWELEEAHLNVRTYGQRPMDGGMRDQQTKAEALADTASAMKYFKDQGSDMTPAEYKRWMRLADGK
jgi:hypothetical protein